MNWKIALMLILLLVLVVFTVQNYQVVEIRFLFWAFQASRAIILFSALLAGVAIGWIASAILRRG